MIEAARGNGREKNTIIALAFILSLNSASV
jgi:hypothetical protein